MNWVEYLEQNCHVTNPYDIEQLRKAVELSALSLQFKYGWKNFTTQCTGTSMYLAYTTDTGLYTAFVPIMRVVRALTIKPILEEIVEKHTKEDTYRKSLHKK